jgi:hypothetical protein
VSDLKGLDPLLAGIIAEAGAGPPEDPCAAAFWDVVEFLASLALREARPERASRVGRVATDYIEGVLAAASGKASRREQLDALRLFRALGPSPLLGDGRRRRARFRWGPLANTRTRSES